MLNEKYERELENKFKSTGKKKLFEKKQEEIEKDINVTTKSY